MTAVLEPAPLAAQPRTLLLLVTSVRLEADGVISLTLTDPQGDDLPPWQPGAHIELELPSGLRRQYSLCGLTSNRKEYIIAVLRQPGGRGGSLEVHTTGLVGRQLRFHGPRNHFKLQPSARYLFIAGGIGVTPLLAMARSLGSNAPW